MRRIRTKSKYSLNHEKRRLSILAKGFSMEKGFTGKMTKYMAKTVLTYLKNGNILDVGCADGIMAAQISSFCRHITAIDASKELIAKAKKRNLKNVDFIVSLYEEFMSKQKFDTIILSDILEHIDSPIKLLKRAKSWLKKNGVLIILSPNANSIHRRIGVLAGMLSSPTTLNDTDRMVGHRRVYTMDLLQKHVRSSGLRCETRGGIFLKPLSDSQMNLLDEKVIDAFYKVGKTLNSEDLALIYLVCKL